jgi:hypothetical protein
VLGFILIGILLAAEGEEGNYDEQNEEEDSIPTAIKSERKRKGERQYLIEWNYGNTFCEQEY